MIDYEIGYIFCGGRNAPKPQQIHAILRRKVPKSVPFS